MSFTTEADDRAARSKSASQSESALKRPAASDDSAGPSPKAFKAKRGEWNPSIAPVAFKAMDVHYVHYMVSHVHDMYYVGKSCEQRWQTEWNHFSEKYSTLSGIIFSRKK